MACGHGIAIANVRFILGPLARQIADAVPMHRQANHHAHWWWMTFAMFAMRSVT